jgi:hypothetical protein
MLPFGGNQEGSTMTGYEFTQGQFQDVNWLVEQTDLMYNTKIVPKGGPDKVQATMDKVIALRKWEPALPLIRKNIARVIEEEGIFYVPKQLAPGPCIVFPQMDLYGKPARARVKTFYDLKIKDDIAKYGAIGMKSTEFAGPAWIGNTKMMLERIIKARFVIPMEGPFDYLACRCVAPEAPFLSSGTKTLGIMHLAYLRMLGVKRLPLLFDNEERKTDSDTGQVKLGAVDTMYTMQRKIENMQVEILLCPAQDPSKCLESYQSARQLQQLLSDFNISV